MNVVIRTADQLHKAEIEVDPNYKSADVIQAAVDNWSLPTDTDYSLVNITKNRTISPGVDLTSTGIEEGDMLEIQPILVAG